MDPLTIVAASVAVVLALFAMLQMRRASELEEKVRELEAKLAAQLPPPEEPEPREEPPPQPEEEPEEEPEPEEEEPEPEEEEPEPEEEEPEPEEEEPEPEEEEPEPEEEEPEPEEEEPEPAKPEPPAPAKPDNRRMLALKVVSEAFETCRYLDFSAIVEKPTTYRCTVPITAANAEGVRFLEEGMFPCLKKVILEDDKAILHIDVSEGPP